MTDLLAPVELVREAPRLQPEALHQGRLGPPEDVQREHAAAVDQLVGQVLVAGAGDQPRRVHAGGADESVSENPNGTHLTIALTLMLTVP